MTLIDLGVLAVLALCVVVGLHRGFIKSLLSLGASLLAMIIVLTLMNPGVRWVKNHTGLYNQILYFTEGNQLLAQSNAAQRQASSFTPDELDPILAGAKRLPRSVINPIGQAVLGETMKDQGVDTLEEYINNTLTNLVINAAVFIVLFIAVSVLLHVCIGMAGAIFKLPVLKQLDGLLGGIAGLLVGLLVVLVVFCAVPVMQSVLPVDAFAEMIAKSRTATVIQEMNFLLGGVLRNRL